MLDFRANLGRFPPSWNSSDVCSWQFVTCSGPNSTALCSSGVAPVDTNITAIDTNGTDRELRGSFPSRIADISTLVTLNLFGQHMNGSLPADIGRLRSLTTLWLGITSTSTIGQDLGGALPASMRNLTELRTLVLNYTLFTGSIDFIVNLTKLELLDLQQNSFDGSIPDLAQLPNLRTLMLRNNLFTGNVTVPSWLTVCDLRSNLLQWVSAWWNCRSAAGDIGVPVSLRLGAAPTTGSTTGVSDVGQDSAPAGDQTVMIVSVAVGVGAGVVVLIVVVVIVALIYSRRRAKFVSPSPSSGDPEQPRTHTRQGSHMSVDSVQGGKAEPPEGRLEIIPFSQLRFVKELGSGSFGQVYKGIYKSKPVAIKISMAVDPKHITEFLGEAEIMTSIKHHKNVLRLYGICIHESKPIIVLEFMGGGTLLGHLQSTVYISEEQQLKLLRGIAEGMRHLAEHNLVHRDLAARNILLDDAFEPKIADFGMSRVVQGDDKVGQTQTNMGPIRWMAPESIRNLVYSEASDVWSFGVLTWEIVTRKAPHAEMSLLELAVKIRDHGITPGVPGDAPPYVQQLLGKCWQFEALHRPAFSEICEFLGRVRLDSDSTASAARPAASSGEPPNDALTIQVE